MRRYKYCAAILLCISATVHSQQTQGKASTPVPELGFKVVPNFFERPDHREFGEAAAVAVNSKGHIFLFQRTEPMLCEYSADGHFIRSLGQGLFVTPHGLRVDAEDNLWTTDVGSHIVLKLSPEGHVLLVLGHKGQGAEGDWVFNRPADIAFDESGNIYIADGYGNSRVIKFDATGNFLKSWGRYGTGPGEFHLPHGIVIDSKKRVYVADRENARVQVFDEEGRFLEEWDNVGYPYGLALMPNGHLLIADGGFDRLLEVDTNGHSVGSIGEPGHAPGQFAWAHSVAIGKDGKAFVADTLNWRFQAFVPAPQSGKMSGYVPSVRKFNDTRTSTGWVPQHTSPAPKTP
jgi:DNA-binding beta-propeller fold protein YncE